MAKANKSKKRPSKMELDDEERNEFLLQELASTDPILSKLSTKTVIDAFRKLLSIYPDVTKKKESTRRLLRRASTGQTIYPYKGKPAKTFVMAEKQEVITKSEAGLRNNTLLRPTKAATPSKLKKMQRGSIEYVDMS